MKYSNLQIYNELKRIKDCHQKYDDLEQVGKEIYKIKNVGIRNYLTENRYIEMNTSNINRQLPFLLPYGNDFLKKWWINCFIEDYKDTIMIIIGIFNTIITGVIIYILTQIK